MPRMYTFNSAARSQYIFISSVFGHEKLDLHNMMLFSLLDQLDTLKYDYISHYFVLRYTLTSVLTLYDHDGAVFLLWFKQTCSLLYKITEGGCRHTFSKKLLHYHKEIHFSMPNRFSKYKKYLDQMQQLFLCH